MIMNIIPMPRKIDLNQREKVCCREFTDRETAGLKPDTAALLEQDFPGSWRHQASTAEFHARLLRPGATPPAPAEVPDKPDAYVLRILPDGVCIDAASASGVWYGLQTLRQLIAEDECIPTGEIIDYAAIPLRGFHVDLKGYLPKFERLLDDFRRLAYYKVNLVLLELEDKYDYRCAPEVGVPGAYTFEQLRTLSRHAAALGIEIIPKVQCFAHVDYLLKIPRYRHLREGDHPYQYCPRNDEVFALWRAMATEVMEALAEHRGYFHIGADEADNLGSCPRCTPYSKADSYLFHVDRCLDFLIARGRTPIMWDDMFRDPYCSLGPGEAEKILPLAEKAILNYWSYGYSGNNNTFPFMAEYRRRGARVWGSSAFASCDNWAGSIPHLNIRAKNLDAWLKTALEHNLEAVIATGWSRMTSSTPPIEPRENLWFSLVYAAESMWSGRSRDLNELIDLVSMHLYHRLLPYYLRRAVMNIAENPVVLNDAQYGECDDIPEMALLQYTAAAESLSKPLAVLTANDRMFYGQIGDRLADYLLDSRRALVRKFLADLDKLETEVRRLMGEFYEPVTVEDFVRTRFGYCRHYAKDLAERLERTKPL